MAPLLILFLLLKIKSCCLRLRPNDPNDKTVSEELKVAILRVAELRQRTGRTNHSLQLVRDPTGTIPGVRSPLFEDPSSTLPHWSPDHLKTKSTSHLSSLTVPIGNIRMEVCDRNRLGHTFGREGRDKECFPFGPRSGTTPPQYDYFLRRLEEKIMDRMKVQMDTLYQRIEDRIMQMK